MLQYAIVFPVIAVIAAALGARGVAGMSAQIGYVLLGLAVIFLVVSLLTGCAPAPATALVADPAVAQVTGMASQGGVP